MSKLIKVFLVSVVLAISGCNSSNNGGGTVASVVVASSNADLSGLIISAGLLDQAFGVNTTGYTVTVANAIASTTVTPVTADANATVTVNGVAVTSGSPSNSIALAVGNAVITIVVTAEDSTTTRSYAITVTRASLLSGTRVMFFTSNWGDDSLKITDDLLSYADGSTATPDRLIQGSNTQIDHPGQDSIFVDETRNLIYVVDNANFSGIRDILVYENATTATGDIAPSRVILIAGLTRLAGVELDTTLDRLYVTGSVNTTHSLYIFDNASTLSGTPVPTAIINGIEGNGIALDDTNDRLFVSGNYNQTIYVFDSASTLVSASTPDRTINLLAGFSGPASVWIDESTDRLYISSNWTTAAGNGLFAFENAATLSGGINADTGSSMRIAGAAITVMIDDLDNLYTWVDSATAVKIYNNASTLTGDVSVAPDLTIGGVVSSGYGMYAVFY